MNSRAHIAEALEAELVAPCAVPDTRAADMAFAVGSAALFMGLNTLAPVAGGAAAVCLAVQGNHLRSRYVHAPEQHVAEVVDYELACRTLPRATESWRRWAPWAELHDGAHVDVPEDLEHPAEVGFEPTRLASYCGQAEDWAHPLPDGSRLHAHEYADGSVTLHRDRVDPARGPVPAAVHWMSETPEGGALGVALAVVGAATLAWAAFS